MRRFDVPRLTWFAVRLIDPLRSGALSLAEHLDQAVAHGFDFVELHRATLPRDTPVRVVREMLEARGLRLSQLTIGPDFTHPSVDQRSREVKAACDAVDDAQALGAGNVRLVPGKAHVATSTEDGLSWAATSLTAVAEYGRQRGVQVNLENHFRDRCWDVDDRDFATDSALWLRLVEQVVHAGVRVNFDTGQPMAVRTEPVSLLDAVLPYVGYVHAGDRRFGERAHSTIGEGDVDFEAIVRRLSAHGYDGFIALEDSSPDQDVGLARGLEYLRALVAQYWPTT